MFKKYRFAESCRIEGFRFGIDTVRFRDPSFPLHSHEFSEAVVVLEGQGVHLVKKERHPIGAGDVFVLNGDTVHGYDESLALKIANIYYDPKIFLDTRKDLRTLPGFQALFHVEPAYRKDGAFSSRFRLAPRDLARAAGLLALMDEEFKRRQEGYQTLLGALFSELVVFLSRCYARGRGASDDEVSRLAGSVSRIEEKYREGIDLPTLAARAGYSKNHFLRLFKRAFSVSPVQYLIGLRLRKACEFLRAEPDRSITDIAFDVGFNDSNFFSRVFREKMRVSPRQFRARQTGALIS